MPTSLLLCGIVLPFTAETLNQIIDQIHFQLLQSTEAHRLLRRELALSTFEFLSVYFRNTKKKINSNPRGFMCPHKEIMHAWLGRVVSTPDSPVQVTPGLHSRG